MFIQSQIRKNHTYTLFIISTIYILNHLIIILAHKKKNEICSRYLEDEELRLNTHRAAMEMGDDFDFDELKIYHYPERHPDMTITAQQGLLGKK